MGSESAGNGAEQDGDEGRPFDHGVAGRELIRGEMVRQDAVFERTEQRRDHAEQEESDKEDRNGLGGETDNRDAGGAKFRQLEALSDKALVKAVGQFAAEAARGERTAG